MCLSKSLPTTSQLCPVSRGASAPVDWDCPQRDAAPHHDHKSSVWEIFTSTILVTSLFLWLVLVTSYDGEDPLPDGWFGLVGVEPNPGPPKKGQNQQKKGGGTPMIVVKTPTQKSKPQSVGSKIGGWVGDMAQKAIMAITGMGDYTVTSNSLVNTPNGPPAFSSNRHSIVVAHREFVGLVSSTGSGFASNTYFINPTAQMFPWLGALASNFEIFKFRGLVVEYKATSATAVSSTNTALGSVIIATQYNALAPPFVDQIQMEAYEYCTSSVAFTSMIHPIECSPKEMVATELYTDLGYVTGDPRFSILGIVNVATVGQQASSTLGELWVSYEVELIRPRLFGSFPTQGYSFRIGTVNAPASNADIFSALATQQTTNTSALSQLPASMTLDVSIGSNSVVGKNSNTLTFPIGLTGYFLLRYFTSGTTVTVTAPTTWQFNNGAVAQNGLLGTTAVQAVPVTGSTNVSQFIYSIMFTIGVGPFSITAGQPQLVFPAATTLPNSTGSSIEILQFNS